VTSSVSGNSRYCSFRAGWVLPVAGRVLAVVVGVLWYTSALWYYNGFHVPAL
jgi:hypothetical protein